MLGKYQELQILHLQSCEAILTTLIHKPQKPCVVAGKSGNPLLWEKKQNVSTQKLCKCATVKIQIKRKIVQM